MSTREEQGAESPRPWTYRAKVLGAYWILGGTFEGGDDDEQAYAGTVDRRRQWRRGV